MPINVKLPTLAEVRALHEAEPATKATGSAKALYPFWANPVNSTTHLRFLWDRDPENILATVEKHTLRLQFNGMINSEYDTCDSVTCTVPAMTTWGKRDRIQDLYKPYWKGAEAEKALARRFYRRISYYMQGLVVSSPVVEKEPPTNPIRIFALNKSLYETIKQGLSEPDFEGLPWDPETGREFRVVKSQKGEWADYSKSGFAFKPRPLSEAEVAAIQEYGVFDLAEQVGQEPDKATQDLIFEMHNDSLAGEAFDQAKYPGFKAYPERGGGNGKPPGASVTPPNGSSHTSTPELLNAAQEAAVASLKARAPVNRAAKLSAV